MSALVTARGRTGADIGREPSPRQPSRGEISALVFPFAGDEGGGDEAKIHLGPTMTVPAIQTGKELPKREAEPPAAQVAQSLWKRAL